VAFSIFGFATVSVQDLIFGDCCQLSKKFRRSWHFPFGEFMRSMRRCQLLTRSVRFGHLLQFKHLWAERRNMKTKNNKHSETTSVYGDVVLEATDQPLARQAVDAPLAPASCLAAAAQQAVKDLEFQRGEQTTAFDDVLAGIDDKTKQFLERELSRRRFLADAAVVAGGVGLVPALTGTVVAQNVPTGPVPETVAVNLKVNGRVYALKLDPRTSVLEAVREQLGLTGAKKGCNQGTCGACTVHVDGQRIVSCMTLAVMYQGREITTIEGLERGDQLHPLQAAFIENDAFQCGYCTSGQIMSGVACIREGHAGSEAEIREWMSGNICRCSAYPGIVAAIQDAAKVGGV
jgi:xanthine dehydrogenase YagT iron-sulfur-binding subunit